MTQITMMVWSLPRAQHPGMRSQVGLRKQHYKASGGWNSSWAISNPKRWCCKSAALNAPANLENLAVVTGLEKFSFHSNPRKRQCQRMFISSVQFSRSVVSDSLRSHELQHARPPCPSPISEVHSDSRPSSQWCHPAISSSVVPSSSCP